MDLDTKERSGFQGIPRADQDEGRGMKLCKYYTIDACCSKTGEACDCFQCVRGGCEIVKGDKYAKQPDST